MAERLEDSAKNPDGDEVKDEATNNLLARAEMWDPEDSLNELEKDIIRAFHSIQNNDDKWDVHQACMELLDHGDKIRLLQRSQLWYIVACLEVQEAYDSVRECLDEAELCMRRLEDLVNIGAGMFDERIMPLGEAIREKRREVDEGGICSNDDANFVDRVLQPTGPISQKH